MIKLYNTQTRRKVDFEPIKPGKVSMYVCGPTVYNYIHIGNARTFISFDTIRRYLMWRGFDVTFVQNITDVDDKIINKANEEGRSAAEVAAEYSQAFIDDMHAAGVLDPDIRPRATEEIESMIELVETLIERGHAYASEGDVYFSVRSFPEYGKLSGRDVDEMESGHRDLRSTGLDDRKRDPLDFAVWKAAKPGEPSWPSPWGQGRPGWHIECSAMSKKYLGLPFDIHGGGADLVFPHHENEVAQSEAAYGTTFSNYWIHGGMLQINAEKMSKSLGNFLLLRDVLNTTPAPVLRMLMLQTHYRSPLDFSQERLSEAATALGRITGLTERLSWAVDNADSSAASCIDDDAVNAQIAKLKEDFTAAMDDDFNTAGALGSVFTFVGEMNAHVGDAALNPQDCNAVSAACSTLVELMGVLGIDLDAQKRAGTEYPSEVITLAVDVASYDGSDAEEAVEALLACRAEARKNKDFAVADAVRDGLGALGFTIEDTPQGARVSF